MPDSAALERGGGRKGVDEARFEVAGVAKVDGGEFFAALVESE